MTTLVPALIPLDKGLNLQAAKLVAPPGSILNTLNYEQVDFQGQKRIDGYTRYDGSFLATIDEFHRIIINATLAVTAGDLISTDNGLLGVAVSDEQEDDDNNLYFDIAILNPNILPLIDDSVWKTLEGNVSHRHVESLSTGISVSASPAAHQTSVISYNAVLRAKVGKLSGSIIGLHWFRDRLYAVANVVAFVLEGDTPIVFPNDSITVTDFTDPDNPVDITTKVLDSFLIHNDDTDSDDRAVLVSYLDPSVYSNGTEVFRGMEDLGGITIPPDMFDNTKNQSSFFESRNEQQVLDEDGPSGPYVFGWKFFDQGWIVSFEDGISLFGSLPSLNQNITGLGAEGPTSIVDPNGSPLALAQKLPLTNRPQQVNGWKSSSTPTTFALNPADVAEIDSAYTYADAFISWDGTSGVVSAPGLNSETLVEYPANNTVVVEV